MFNKCRACLGTTQPMQILSKETPQRQMFTTVNKFEWLDSPLAPSFLCKNCTSLLDIAYKFQETCLDSHKKIKVLLDSAKSPPEQVPEVDHVEEVPAQRRDVVVIIKKQKREKIIEKADTKSSWKLEKFPAEVVQEEIDKYNERNKPRSLVCIVCSQKVGSVAQMSLHVKNQHRDVWERWCPRCNVIVDILKKHIKSHQTLADLCVFCNRKVKKKIYTRHLKEHCDSEMFRCNICSKGYISKVYYKIHLSKHVISDHSGYTKKNPGEIEENGDFVCRLCSKAFSTEEGLNSHSKTHKQLPLHKCKLCAKLHLTKTQLEEHERLHTGEKPYSCNLCHKSFRTGKYLESHLRMHIDPSIMCGLCDKSFGSFSALQTHLRTHRGLPKCHSCQQCGKKFVTAAQLTRHKRTHGNERPFKCHLCAKSFKLKSYLYNHYQVHGGYKPHKCKFCDYSTLKSDTMRWHLKRHQKNDENAEKAGKTKSRAKKVDGAAPKRRRLDEFFCDRCQKNYGNPVNFDIHLEKFHGEQREK